MKRCINVIEKIDQKYLYIVSAFCSGVLYSVLISRDRTTVKPVRKQDLVSTGGVSHACDFILNLLLHKTSGKKKMNFTKIIIVVLTIFCLVRTIEATKITMVGGQSLKNLPSKAAKALETVKKFDPTYLNNKLNFEKIKTSYSWFKKLKEYLDSKRENSQSQPMNTNNLETEIKTCKPDDGGKCFSPCSKTGGTQYQWCFLSSEKRSGNWGYCSCQIKQSIIDYLSITKQEMLTKKEETLTTLEITLIVIVCVSLVMSIGIGVGGVVYWKRNNNQMPGMNNGVFIPNPLYQNPEA